MAFARAQLLWVRAVLPELDVERVRDFCQARVPDRALHQVRVEMDASPGALTIVEVRAPWRADQGPEWTRRAVARLRYVQRTGVWTLYYTDRNQRFHRYQPIGSSARIEVLLEEIDRDPTLHLLGLSRPRSAASIAAVVVIDPVVASRQPVGQRARRRQP